VQEAANSAVQASGFHGEYYSADSLPGFRNVCWNRCFSGTCCLHLQGN